MIKFDFKNKTAVITGAGSGIGKCIAESFASAGANVVVADINADSIDKVCKDLGNNAMMYELNVTDYNNFNKMIDKTIEHFGSFDILVNCAGICISKPIDDFEIEEINRLIDINLKGTILGCKSAIPYMKRKKRGKIVNLSSIAGRLCNENSNIYASVKAGIMALTTALAREVAQYNININSVLPGIIRTNMWENLLNSMAGDDENKKQEVFNSFTKEIPLARPQEVIDIANMVMYLCSDEANNITAQNIAVDGGETA